MANKEESYKFLPLKFFVLINQAGKTPKIKENKDVINTNYKDNNFEIKMFNYLSLT